MSAPSRASHGPTGTLKGTLARTPLPRLLVSASAARVSGTLELSHGGAASVVTFAGGCVTKVKTAAPVAYLGAVLYELGYIEADELNESLSELARTRWLHGEILLTRASLTAAQLGEALAEQTARKLVSLFRLPPETAYAFDADVDRLAAWGGSDAPHVDPVAAVWRALRDGHAADEVEASMGRVRTSAFRLVPGSVPARLGLSDAEASAVEHLRVSPLTLDDLAGMNLVDARRARALVYLLLLTKQAEVADTSGVRAAFRASLTDTQPSAGVEPRHGARSSAPPRLSESDRWRAVAPATEATSGAWPTRESVTLGGIDPRTVSSSPPPRESYSRSISPFRVERPSTKAAK